MLQISLPKKMYDIYTFFDNSKKELNNPFTFLKMMHGIPVTIISNKSNLNYYQIDIPIHKNIKPSYLLKYLKQIDYRNYYSSNTIYFKQVNIINENKWIETELYQGVETTYVVNYNPEQFYILFYNMVNNSDSNISQAKYYHSLKIFKSFDTFILRFEITLNYLDIDQLIDIEIYLNMLINIIGAIYKKFNLDLNFNYLLELETIKYLEFRNHKK